VKVNVLLEDNFYRFFIMREIDERIIFGIFCIYCSIKGGIFEVM